MSSYFNSFLKRAKTSISNIFNTGEIVKFLISEIKRKRSIYPFFIKKVRFLFSSFNKINCNNEIIENYNEYEHRTEILKYFYHDDKITENKKVPEESLEKLIPKKEEFKSKEFFFEKFWEIFKFFIIKFFPFRKNSIELVSSPIKLYDDILFKIKFTFNENEINLFNEFTEYYKIQNINFNAIVYLLFATMIRSFYIIIKKIIKDNYIVELVCSNLSYDNINLINPKCSNENYILLLIGIRQNESTLNDLYLKTDIFHFSELFGDKIPKSFQKKLKTEKDLIYLLALDRYRDIEPCIDATLRRIYEKCITLNDIKPILDIFNFIASRVEDSIWSVQDFVQKVINENNNFKRIESQLLKLFKLVNSNSMIFSTFQSNNKTQVYEQYNLFVLYSQLFFLDNNKLFFKEEFKKHLDKQLNSFNRNPQYIYAFHDFLKKAFILSNNASIDIFFKNVFGNSLFDLNIQFFHHFITSLNKKLFELIDEINKNEINKKFTFENLINFLIEILSKMIKNVFLNDNILKATENFYDKRSRYSPKRLALRTLEIIFFRELPISDNNWMNYNLSRNINKVKEIFKNYLAIPSNYFFSKKTLLDINLIYNTKIETQKLLEEWLVIEIFTPFCKFLENIIKNFRINNNSILQDEHKFISILNDSIMKIISKGIINEEIIESLELISENLTEIISNHVINLI